jgi:chromosome segregation ATPase
MNQLIVKQAEKESDWSQQRTTLETTLRQAELEASTFEQTNVTLREKITELEVKISKLKVEITTKNETVTKLQEQYIQIEKNLQAQKDEQGQFKN